MLELRSISMIVFKSVKKTGSARKFKVPLRPVGALFLLLLVCFGLNFHLFALQLFGWSGMILDYKTPGGSWAEAAAKTVSGEAPCAICQQVEAALQARDEAKTNENPVIFLPFQLALFLPLFKKQAVLKYPDSFAALLPLPKPAHELVASPPASPPPRG